MYIVCFNSLFRAVIFFVLPSRLSYLLRSQLVFKCSQLPRYWHTHVRTSTQTRRLTTVSMVCLCALSLSRSLCALFYPQISFCIEWQHTPLEMCLNNLFRKMIFLRPPHRFFVWYRHQWVIDNWERDIQIFRIVALLRYRERALLCRFFVNYYTIATTWQPHKRYHNTHAHSIRDTDLDCLSHKIVFVIRTTNIPKVYHLFRPPPSCCQIMTHPLHTKIHRSNALRGTSSCASAFFSSSSVGWWILSCEMQITNDNMMKATDAKRNKIFICKKSKMDTGNEQDKETQRARNA